MFDSLRYGNCNNNNVIMVILYSQILWDKLFAKSSYLCIIAIFKGENFANAVKVAIPAMQSLTQDKIFRDKIFANESRWRNWQKFSPGQNFQLYGILFPPLTLPPHIVRWSHLEVVKYLIEVQECSAGCTDNSGQTPLHLACR